MEQVPSASVARSTTAVGCVLHRTFATESLQAYFGIFVALAVVPLFLHRHFVLSCATAFWYVSSQLLL